MELKACDFAGLIAEKKRDYFNGTRLWVFDEVRKWSRKSDSRLFWLVGDAGTGKSVVTAKLFDLPDVNIVAWHFCRHDNVAQSDPRVILASWYAMLRSNIPNFKSPTNEAKLNTGGALEMFDALIAAPFSQLPTTTAPCVIVLDALDELPKDSLSAVLQLLTDAFEKLPRFVKVLVTSRDYSVIRNRLSRFNPLTLEVDEMRNLQDLRSYLASVARCHIRMEFKLSDLEVQLEKQLGLAEGTLRGKLDSLQEPIQKSADIYGLVAERVMTQPGYQEICRFIDAPPTALQTESDLDKLYEDAAAARAVLRGMLASEWVEYRASDEGKAVWQVPAPGKAAAWVDNVVDPGLKTRASAARKVETEYKGDVRLIKDLARFTATCANCTRMTLLLNHLRSQHTLEIVGMRNKYVNPSPMGYRDINLSIRVQLANSRTHICELQVNIEDMLVAKARAHCHYETVRSLVPRICQEANIVDANSFQTVLMKLLRTPVFYTVLRKLEAKAGGLFLYASLLEQQLEDDGGLDVSKLDSLPTGLGAIYKVNFDRVVGTDTTQWAAYSRVVAMIVVSRELLPREFAQDAQSAFATVVDRFAVLFPLRDGVFHVMHKTVVEWLRDRKSQNYYISDSDVKEAHSTLADKLLQHLSVSLTSPHLLTSFALRHVIYHLCEAGRESETRSLLTSLHWLLARVQVSEPQTLIEDVARSAKALDDRLLRLLASALRLAAGTLRSDWRYLPAQLVGRLVGYEKEEKSVASFLDAIREWKGPENGRGWWCPVVQSLEAAGGPTLFTCRHSNRVNSVQWSPDGSLICAGSSNLVWLWHADSGRIAQTLSGHSDEVTSACWSPDGKRLCSSSKDKTVRVWDLNDGQCLRVLSHPEIVSCVSWANSQIYSAAGRCVRQWDVESGICLRVLESVNKIQRMCLSSTGQICALDEPSGGESQTRSVRVWGGDKWIEIPDTSYSNCAAWSEDGRLAVPRLDGSVRVWQQSGESFQCLRTFSGKSGVANIVWVNNNVICTTDVNDHTLLLWEVHSGKRLATLPGHTDVICSIVCSKDGRICSGSIDRTLRVVDTTITKWCQSVRHADEILTVAWDSDGKAYTGGYDQELRVWDLETGAFTVLQDGPGQDDDSLMFRDFVRIGSLSPFGIDADVQYCLCPSNSRRAICQTGTDNASLHLLHLRGT